MALSLPATVVLSTRHIRMGCLLLVVTATWSAFFFYNILSFRPTLDVDIRSFVDVAAPLVGAPVPASRQRSSGQRRSATGRPQLKEERRGDYVVLRNALPAQVVFGEYDSVTLTTHGTYEQLANLLLLVRQWDGPLSVALYAPRDDFRATLLLLLWLRRCHRPVSDMVTFHFVYPAPGASIWVSDRPPWSEPNRTLRTESTDGKQRSESTSSEGEKEEEDAGLPYDYLRVLEEVVSADPVIPTVPCTAAYPVKPHQSGLTYRQRHGLTLPINVCRNVARSTATTRYVLAADIELIPSAGVVDMFLEFIARNDSGSGSAASLRRVYVLPHFEVHAKVDRVPNSKSALVELYREGLAVDFHKYRMAMGHVIPRVRQWLQLPVADGKLQVFATVKRERPFTRWEPFYVGTNDDPTYTEGLTWEGMQNKLTQMYEMCLLNYDLAILDNAFLIHRPGIKRRNVTEMKYRLPYIERNLDVYETEVRKLEGKHGANPNCR